MNLKRVLFIVVVVLIAGAYAAGYWPEHARSTQAEAQVAALQAKLDAADARVRVGEVLGHLLRLSDAVDARNYGEATTLSSTYFDRVRTEASRPHADDVKRVLEGIQQNRDQVTTALARSEPSIPVLREQELALRRALGYPVPAPAVDAPPPVRP